MIVIYLDQNVLSNLRDRKINEMTDSLFSELKDILRSERVLVVYSYVTLIEIQQISKEEFKIEHIKLLEEMNAAYIEPQSRILRKDPASKIWGEFLENKEFNHEYGLDKIMPILYLSQRKMVGLPISESFIKINEELKHAFSNIMLNTRKAFCQLDWDKELEGLDELTLTLIKHNLSLTDKLMNFYLEQISKMEMPDIDERDLGVQAFRESSEVKNLKVETIPAEHVISAIENIFHKENKNFKLSDYMEDTLQARVSYAYELMNWIGYYADDFTKNMKKKDRFNASRNDMMHVVNAVGSSFLISDDECFLKKAYACYCFVNSETVVCTPYELVNNYNFNL